MLVCVPVCRVCVCVCACVQGVCVRACVQGVCVCACLCAWCVCVCVCACTPSNAAPVQVVLVSATLPAEVLEMTAKFMTNPLRILVKR